MLSEYLNNLVHPSSDFYSLQRTLTDDMNFFAQDLSASLNVQSLLTMENPQALIKFGEMSDSSSIFQYKDYGNVQKTFDYYWDMGDNYHNGVIDIDKYPVRIRLLCYGLSQEAKFGDIPADKERPATWNIKAQKKFDAWTKQSGRPRTDARKDFIQLTEAILAV